MRKLFYAILAVVVAISAGPLASAEDKPQAKVIAYYFHVSFRCPTCNIIEKYSREAIETNFKDVLASGMLEFKAVNVEERGNEHFANDYKLYAQSLILSLVKDGEEVKSKNLDSGINWKA